MVKEVVEDEENDIFSYIGGVEVNSVNANKDWLADLSIQGHQRVSKIDTEAQVNVILQKLVHKLVPPVRASNAKLTAYSGG